MYLFEQKLAALYYQTGKFVTLIMALMKSVTTPTLYIDSLSKALYTVSHLLLNNSPLF